MGTRLNVLFVFSDQETAAATRPAARTPWQDALAARAVTFTQALCTSPQCTPSRGTLLTGRYPHQTGVETNLDAVGARELPEGVPTLGTMLGGAGYATAYFGKWHLSQAGPSRHGFATVYEAHRHGAEEDAAIAGEAVAWLASRPPEPWCAVVSFTNPHDITRVRPDQPRPIRHDATLPANLRDDLSRKPSPQAQFVAADSGRPYAQATDDDWLRYRSAYAGYLEALDACLGQVLQALADSGQEERTVVISTSDHGDLVGAHGLAYKGPFLYDELVHVPLHVAWPGYRPGVRTEMVSLIHLVPTMRDAAGLPADPALPGRSLRPLLRGTAQDWPDWAVFEYLAKQRWLNPIRGLRRGRWQYTRYLWDGEELYDRASDPGECRNLAADPEYAPMLAQLRADLDRWRENTGDAGRWERPRGM